MEVEADTIEIQDNDSSVELVEQSDTLSKEEEEEEEPNKDEKSEIVDESVEEPVKEQEHVEEPPAPKIKITLKSPKEKEIIQVAENAAIKDIKTIAADKFAADPEYLCLIFAGKMMEDDDTLETHGIQEGMTIHLIIKSAPREPEPGKERPPADVSQTPFGLNSLGGLAGLQSIGMGSSNFMELQNRLQTELLGNPELLKRVLENPLVQSLMNDSKSMKTLIKQNSHMQDLMSRHPEIRSMLRNSDLLKQTAELAKNPSMLQELMRNIDGSNPMEGTETYTTLPNLFNAYQSSGLASASGRVAASQKPPSMGNVFSNPQMSSLLQQMSEHPQLVQNMMKAPYTQAMLQALSADSSMATAIVNENPLYKNNAALQQYLSSMMPQLLQQMQNPEIMNIATNPQAVNALLQIQEGLDQLRNAAPGFVNNLGYGVFNDSPTEQPSTSKESENEEGAAAAAAPPPPPQPPLPTDDFSQFMARMITQMGQTDYRLPPEQRYKIQMDHLKNMGFNNEAVNLQILTAVFGDINAAVQRLLAQNSNLV